jgi:hypothetical protein
MAAATGVTPEQLSDDGREDGAQVLRVMLYGEQPRLTAVAAAQDHGDGDPADPNVSVISFLVDKYGGDDADGKVVRGLAEMLKYGKDPAVVLSEIRAWLRIIGAAESNGTTGLAPGRRISLQQFAGNSPEFGNKTATTCCSRARPVIQAPWALVY